MPYRTRSTGRSIPADLADREGEDDDGHGSQGRHETAASAAVETALWQAWMQARFPAPPETIQDA